MNGDFGGRLPGRDASVTCGRYLAFHMRYYHSALHSKTIGGRSSESVRCGADFAVRQQVLSSPGGDKNTLRIGIVVLGPPR